LASSFGAKFNTKGEIWRFLTVEAKVYLPSYATVTIWFMKELASGEKKVRMVKLIHIIIGYFFG
jgi:hypothetical protein